MEMKPFRVKVLVVPPQYEVLLGIAQVRHEWRILYGTSRADALRRAGIQA